MTMSDDTQQAYSLENLKDWVNDAIESECTPKEIYDSIIDTVKNSRKYHKACYDDSVRLLTLLRGNKNSNIKVHDRNDTHIEEVYPGIKVETPDGITTEWNEYWKGNLYGEEFQQALEKYGYEYTPPTEEEVRRFRLDSPFLHNEEDN